MNVCPKSVLGMKLHIDIGSQDRMDIHTYIYICLYVCIYIDIDIDINLNM